MTIDRFYAVTASRSIYQVTSKGEGSASAIKIALDGTSKIDLGQELCEPGQRIGISTNLITYSPRGHQHDPSMINGRYWGIGTSNIVALFQSEEEARACLEQDDIRRNPRPEWLQSTKEVIRLIGRDHPSFYVLRAQGLSLLGMLEN